MRGLHQFGKFWYEKTHCKLFSNGFKKTPGIKCIYHYQEVEITIVYVDDI